MSRRGNLGFTLLEVVVAVFVFATVMAGLISQVSQNTRALANAREELKAARLGEQKLREVLFKAETGELPELGTTDGTFEVEEEGDPPFQFQMDVQAFGVPLPKGAPKQVVEGSRLFAGGGQPAVRRIELRVFRTDLELEQPAAFVAFVAEPNEPAEPRPGEGEGQNQGEDQGGETGDDQQNEERSSDDISEQE